MDCFEGLAETLHNAAREWGGGLPGNMGPLQSPASLGELVQGLVSPCDWIYQLYTFGQGAGDLSSLRWVLGTAKGRRVGAFPSGLRAPGTGPTLG